MSTEFTTETAEPLVVTVTPVAPLDAFLEVTSPDQPSEVANQETGGGLEQVVLVAPVAGEHRVTVSGTSSGEYRLAVRRTDVEELAVGETVPAVVDDQGQQVVYRFNASVDTPVALELVASDDEFDGYLEVRYPTGVLGWADTGGQGEGERVLLASSSGWHRIVVGGSPAGRVELSVLPVEVPSISTAAPVGGSTTDSDAVEDFVFDGRGREVGARGRHCRRDLGRVARSDGSGRVHRSRRAARRRRHDGGGGSGSSHRVAGRRSNRGRPLPGRRDHRVSWRLRGVGSGGRGDQGPRGRPGLGGDHG